MNDFFIGRKNEIRELLSAFNSNQSLFYSIIGRRGVGKTYLINHFYKKIIKTDFLLLEYTGRKKVSKIKQIDLFLYETKKMLNISDFEFDHKTKGIKHWNQVFDFLAEELKKEHRKILLVIDEFAWFHTKQSNFAEEFGIFWNKIKTQNNIFILISGSAVSWMNKNVFYSKGSLYHKTSKIIKLKPFSYTETTEFFKKKSPHISIMEIVQYYLLTGGVVRYLDKIRLEQNIQENLNNIFQFFDLSENNEFQNLFDSTFNSNKTNLHREIVELFQYKNHLTIDFIFSKLNKVSVQSIYSALNDLIVSDIVLKIENIKDKNKPIYILSDLFCFYNVKLITKNNHLNLFDGDLLNKYNGYAFELFAFLNTDFIKSEIGRNGIISKQYKFQNENTQIDMLIDYGKHQYSIVECKFLNNEFLIDLEYEKNLLNKKNELIKFLKERKKVKRFNIDYIMLTLNGMKKHKACSIFNIIEVTINNE